MFMSSVFAAPSIILRSSGSVGMTFVMWIIGALVASAGTAVYVEFGTVGDSDRLLLSLLISPCSRDCRGVVGRRPTWNTSIADRSS
jgi:hypothetical protein